MSLVEAVVIITVTVQVIPQGGKSTYYRVKTYYYYVLKVDYIEWHAIVPPLLPITLQHPLLPLLNAPEDCGDVIYLRSIGERVYQQFISCWLMMY